MNRQQLRKRLEDTLTSAIAALVIASLGGCALTTEHVTIDFRSQGYLQKIPGADAVKVKVSVQDTRPVPGKVSAKKNGYGMEMAPIVADNNVAETLAKGIEAELANRGFVLASDPVLVNVDLRKFYNDFKPS